MKNISFWKKLKLFLLFRKTLKNIENEIGIQFNIRIDQAYRLYTVINLPTEEIDENYNLSRAYLETILERLLTDYSNSLSAYLNSKGLNELYEFYEITKITKYSFLVVYGFSLFKSDRFINNLYKIIPIIIGAGIGAFFFYLLVQYVNSY